MLYNAPKLQVSLLPPLYCVCLCVCCFGVEVKDDINVIEDCFKVDAATKSMRLRLIDVKGIY